MTTIEQLAHTIRTDYQNFPHNQTYDIYSDDVFFKDPLTEFRGLDAYKRNIAFIEKWFGDPELELHALETQDSTIITRWTLTWTTPLPWKPRVSIPGWSELKVDDGGAISSHIDYWNCSKWDVVKQHVWPQSG